MVDNFSTQRPDSFSTSMKQCITNMTNYHPIIHKTLIADSMKTNRKPTAIPYAEGDKGFFTLRCTTKEQAKKAIEDYIKGDNDYEGVVVRLDAIEEDRMFYHNRCEYYSIGENICQECGESCGTNGRRTFTFNY